ncbi:MAG: hypothetical protein A2W33_06990 [Chloroflexi bacterium RBG_16_52_11]|nr:MAG: hypothetical protein A2W33_06990 [Chloroflexi bacterium RBG_16_52_11]
MKKIAFFLPFLILSILGACTLRVPVSETPTTDIVTTGAPAETEMAPVVPVAPTQLPAVTDSALPTEAAPTNAPPPSVTPLPPTQEVQPALSQPTATAPLPTATVIPVTTLNPYTAYGDPTYVNPMEFANYWEWAPPETDTLPNNQRIRLQFKDGQLYVTGKRLDFSTWWFSSHFLSDAYMEMTFNTEDCSGEDAYGMIFHGPKHLAGISYGYIASFTCGGELWVARLDDAEPWEVEVLIDEEEISAANTGPGEQNVIGVLAEGDRYVIYANGTQVAEFEDDHFEKGRMGVFVRAASPDAYTYRVTNLSYWDFEEEE